MTAGAVDPRPAPETLELGFDATVPRQLIHKAAIEEVLLTDSTRVDDEWFACASVPPRSHRYFNDVSLPIYDTLLFLEIARQCGVLISHRYLDVPEGTQFIFGDLGVWTHDFDAMRIGPEPDEVVSYVTLEDTKHRRGQLARGFIRVELNLRGSHAVTVRGTAGFADRERYSSLRERMRRGIPEERTSSDPQPIDPLKVDRRRPENVAISEPREADGERQYSTDVVVNERHPSFFDHPLDHVPGMLLIEAVRQTAVATACTAHDLDPAVAVVRSCRADYWRFAETEGDVRCDAEVSECRREDGRPAVTVEMSVLQFDTRIAAATIELGFLD